MGIIRLILAIAVMVAHTGPILGHNFFNPEIAVQSFYIISGFYMTLILNEKYTGSNSYRLFISNRLLRILPIYYFIALLSLISAISIHTILFDQDIIKNFNRLPLFSKLYVSIINLTVIGQDSTLFLGFNPDGSLHFVKDFLSTKPQVQSLLLCPTAWSLSLELMFYCVAPFLVRRKTGLILGLLLVSWLLRVILYKNGFFHDPWTYRFFPTELFFFLSGTISYHMYKHIRAYKGGWFIPGGGLLITTGIIVSITGFNNVPAEFILKQYMFYMLLMVAIPFVFLHTKNNHVDRFLGELSYPVYLSHLFVIQYCLPLVHYFISSVELDRLLTILFTLGLSVLIVMFLIKPIDKYREKRINSVPPV